MLIGILTDIHSNVTALEACLAEARKLGVARLVLLGDFVGYGPDPEEVTARIAGLMEEGAVAIQGNHDFYALKPGDTMNGLAAAALAWTRRNIGSATLDFLQKLPLTYKEGDLLFVHADASAPQKWNYVVDSEDAKASLSGTDAEIVFCGHVHVPALFGLSATGKIVSHQPVTNVGIPLGNLRRWQAVIGSVGQPRDRNPAAAFATFDTDTRTLTYRRAPYDIDAVADRIMVAGLPEQLASRLRAGR